MTPTTPLGERTRQGSRRIWLFGVAAVVVAADIGTKQVAINRWADNPIDLFGGITLTESRNPGAAFGLATAATPVLTVLAAVAVMTIVALSGRPKTTTMAVAIGLLLGGAAGNLIDRLVRAPGVMQGHVVDWIDVGAWPTFNLADSALTCAAAVLFVLLLTKPDETDKADAL